ncbi:HU family DNA-binding protein [Endozoicomonas acroporae]|nr:HU family DNA-binding protein [Endozoicomonas acroporae]
MRKPDLVNVIADEADISKDKASLALNAILEAITSAMKSAAGVKQ